MKLLSSDAVRRCIAAPPGYAIISADFDQVELRIAAALARETSLIEAAKRSESLHKIAAVRLFGENYTPDQYRYTKNVNFGWLYGGGARTLSEQAGIPFDAAARIIVEYGSAFPALRKYKARKQESVIRSALTVSEYRQYQSLHARMQSLQFGTTEGRRARLEIMGSMDYLLHGKLGCVVTPSGRRLVCEARKAYRAVNYIVQSYARDVMAAALLRLMADPVTEPTVLLPIHDEVLGMARVHEADYVAKLYSEIMTVEFRGVPLTAAGKVYGQSWGHGYAHN